MRTFFLTVMNASNPNSSSLEDGMSGKFVSVQVWLGISSLPRHLLYSNQSHGDVWHFFFLGLKGLYDLHVLGYHINIGNREGEIGEN